MTTTEQVDDAPTPPAEPRLRIHHLMAWTALAAVMLVVMQTRQLSENTPAVYSAVAWMGPVAAAAAITVLTARFAWRRQGSRWLAAPGHGVALLLVLQYAFYAPVLIVYSMLRTRHADGTTSFDPEFYAGFWYLRTFLPSIGGFIAGIISLVLAWRLADTVQWRLYFIAKPLIEIAGVGFNWLFAQWVSSSAWRDLYYLIYQAPTLMTVALLAVACLVDRRRPRHWTHWWGVLAVVVPALAMFVAISIGVATGGFSSQ